MVGAVIVPGVLAVPGVVVIRRAVHHAEHRDSAGPHEPDDQHGGEQRTRVGRQCTFAGRFPAAYIPNAVGTRLEL